MWKKNAENYFSLKLATPRFPGFLLGGTLSLAASSTLSSNNMVYETAVTVKFSVKERHFNKIRPSISLTLYWKEPVSQTRP